VPIREIRVLIRVHEHSSGGSLRCGDGRQRQAQLLGAFDTIYAPQMPAVHPQCAVALRVTFMPGDEGTRKLKLNFINADGRAIMQGIEMPVPVALPDDAHFLTRNFIVNIQQLKFAEPGCIPWTSGSTTNRRRTFRCW
jgi:hypothetical protein